MFALTLQLLLLTTLFSTNAAHLKLLKAPISSSLQIVPKHISSHHLQGRTDSSAPLQNYVLKVVTTVQAGNNQTFDRVLVDTGSAILWVGRQQRFQPGPQTQNINQTFSIGYGTGSANGIAYRDTVTIGGATANSQIIGAANATQGFFLVEPIDGILGLGPSLSNAGEVSGFATTPTFVETLVSEGRISCPVFGLFVQPPEYPGQLAGQGELTFGGVDQSHVKGNITWLPQNPPLNFRWEFNVSGMSFGTVASTQTAPGRTDSGILSLEIPTDQFFDILPAYNGTLDSTTGFEGFLCFPLHSESTLPSFNIILGNVSFVIPPSQYIISPSLYPTFNMTADRIHTWISPAGFGSYTLGQKFLERVYTAYDMENHRVGFAHTPCR